MFETEAPVTCQFFSRWVRQTPDDGFTVFRIVAPQNHQASDPRPIQVVQIGERGMSSDRCLSADRFPARHENTSLTGLTHKKWTVSAARINLNELIGSFFICMQDEPELDFGGSRNPDGQGFAAFGEVVAGFEVVEKIFSMASDDEWLEREIRLDSIALRGESEAVSVTKEAHR